MSSLDSLLPKLTDEGFTMTYLRRKEDAQRKKRETLKDAIQYGKAHLLPGKKGKWSTEIDKKPMKRLKNYTTYTCNGRQKSRVK